MCRPLSRTGIAKVGESSAERFRKLQQSLRNCTIIDGDLELTYMDDASVAYDLSFLDPVREIWGALIIYHVDVPLERNFLTGLRIIRGKSTCAQCQNAALYVHSNRGLRALPFFRLSGAVSERAPCTVQCIIH